jgi:hypothetical protein
MREPFEDSIFGPGARLRIYGGHAGNDAPTPDAIPATRPANGPQEQDTRPVDDSPADRRG